MTPYLIDTTLRDGEQAPGVAFSIDEKLSIAAMLDEIGVDEVEAGTPAISINEREAIRLITNAGFAFKTSSWCRATLSDLKLASEVNTQSVNISLPVSDVQIDALEKSRTWVIEELKQVLAFARQNFAHITMGAQDASRADRTFLKEFIFYALDSGAKRIRINDTVGVLSPMVTKELISDLCWNFPEVEFEFHGHNDFGMATSNAITALQSGARCVSATVNGLGERAGNAVLEEVMAFCEYNGMTNKYGMKGFKRLSQYVAQVSGSVLVDNKPLLGDKTFMHESGVHTSSMLKNKKAYQVLNPEDYGLTDTSFAYGKHSGRKVVSQFFNEKGIYLSDNDLKILLKELERLSLAHKHPLTDTHLLSIYLNMSELKKAD